MKELTEKEFKSTMIGQMNVVQSEEAPFNFWDYFKDIPENDLDCYDFSEGIVSNVYRSGDQKFDHVMINCNKENVFLVLVLDLKNKVVFGHKLLNLNKEYGLET